MFVTTVTKTKAISNLDDLRSLLLYHEQRVQQLHQTSTDTQTAFVVSYNSGSSNRGHGRERSRGSGRPTGDRSNDRSNQTRSSSNKWQNSSSQPAHNANSANLKPNRGRRTQTSIQHILATCKHPWYTKFSSKQPAPDVSNLLTARLSVQ